MKTLDQMKTDAQTFEPLKNIFFEKVCLKGLWDRIDEETTRGMRGYFWDIELRTFVLGGRTLITLTNDRDQITFITDDHERKAIFLHTCEGLAEDLMWVMLRVIKEWPATPDHQRRIFRADPDISIGL